ncbi:ABC transporter permease, partial [Rhizobium ruizarguesonis]
HPNALPPVLPLSATIVAGAILTEAAQSFLGLGKPNIATWGSMIAEGRSVKRSRTNLSVIPRAALANTVLGVHHFSEGHGKA